MGWTAPKTWTSTTHTAAELNEQVRDNETWLKSALSTIGQTSDSTLGQIKSAAYGCVLIRTADQTIANDTDVAVTFPTGSMTEELDSDGFHSGASNTARITIPSGGQGWYDIGACVAFDSDADGYRSVWAELNGQAGTGTSIIRNQVTAGSAIVFTMNISGFYLLAAGDYVTLNVHHTAGASLALKATAYSIRFWAMRRFSS